MTVGELKAVLADLPDDMRIEHYSGSTESLVEGTFKVCDEFDFYTDNPLVYDSTLVVWHEN